MGLAPDEIAQRAFTPSADGYHQGEVRSFLRRIASELRALQSVHTDGRIEVPEMTGVVRAPGSAAEPTPLAETSPALLDLEYRIEDVLAELRATTAVLQRAQAETTEQLATAQKLVEDQRLIAEQAAGHRTAAPNVAEDLPAPPAPSTPAVINPAPAAPIEPPTPERSGIIPRAITDPHLRDETSAAASAPLPPPPPSPSPSPSPTDPLSILGSDLDDRPLFSDNANDLLDGVLDDVMGNLSEEGN